MNNNNRVQLTGNLGSDPKVRSFDNGNKVANFSIATREDFINKSGEKAVDTQWHNVTAWGKVAEKVESELKKGSFVSVEGRLVTRHYNDKDGQKKYITEVIASDLVINDRAA